MIVPMAAEHVEEIARLHCASLKGLLTVLGPRAARAYYRGGVRTSSAVGFVFLEDATVRGFVLGSAEPGALKRDVLRANPLDIAFALGAGIIRRPTSLVWLVKSVRGPDEGSYDPHAAELTYLAVSAARRSGGIGRGLVEAFTRAMRERGVSSYELSVDEDNGTAIGFYEKLGFCLVGRYREFDVLHCRYRLDVTRD